MLGVDSSQNHSASELPAHWNMQPPEGGQYNDVLASDYGGYILASLTSICIFGLVGLKAICRKQVFSYHFVKHFYFSKTLHQGIKPKCTNNYFLSQNLLYENSVEILLPILLQLLEVVHFRGHGLELRLSTLQRLCTFTFRLNLSEKSYTRGVYYGKERIETRTFRRRMQP